MSNLGARVRWLRESAGLSARRMSTLMRGDPNKVRRHIGLIEAGARDNPSLDTLTALSDLFGVSLDWLATGKGERPSPVDVRASVAAAEERATLSRTGTEG